MCASGKFSFCQRRMLLAVKAMTKGENERRQCPVIALFACLIVFALQLSLRLDPVD